MEGHQEEEETRKWIPGETAGARSLQEPEMQGGIKATNPGNSFPMRSAGEQGFRCILRLPTAMLRLDSRNFKKQISASEAVLTTHERSYLRR